MPLKVSPKTRMALVRLRYSNLVSVGLEEQALVEGSEGLLLVSRHRQRGW